MIQRLDAIIEYIEDHLTEDLELSKLANFSGYSLSHLHLLFRRLTGDSLKEYIRARRLSEACHDLIESNQSTVDLAMKYGYQSREAFSRAFEYYYGLSPKEVRDKGYCYTIREPFKLESTLNLDYTIERIGFDLTLIKSYPILESENIQARIPALLMDTFFNSSDDEFIGIFANTNKETTYSLYSIDKSHQKDFYAVFNITDPITESIHKVWRYVYSDSFILEDYQVAEDDHLEYYCSNEGIITSKIYVKLIPLKKNI